MGLHPFVASSLAESDGWHWIVFFATGPISLANTLLATGFIKVSLASPCVPQGLVLPLAVGCLPDFSQTLGLVKWHGSCVKIYIPRDPSAF